MSTVDSTVIGVHNGVFGHISIFSEFPAHKSLPEVYSFYSELYIYIYIVYKDVNSENKWKSP